MGILFEQTQLAGMTLKNRLFRSATWEALAGDKGEITTELHQIYEELAVGGVGTIITGCTDISEESHAVEHCMRLFTDAVVDGYCELTQSVHRHDCNIIVQLNLNDYWRKTDTLP